MPTDPATRSLAARIAAHESWAATSDRKARTAHGRNAFLEKFEREIDPSITDPATRARMAESKRSAYFSRLALKSAKARNKIKEGRRELAEVDTELRGGDPST